MWPRMGWVGQLREVDCQGQAMEFEVREMRRNDDAGRITAAVGSVDPQAQVAIDERTRKIDVDSWLYPEEFLIALYEAGYDARIKRR